MSTYFGGNGVENGYIYSKIGSAVEILKELESSLFPLYLQVEELKLKRRRLHDEIEFERAHDSITSIPMTSLLLDILQIDKQLIEKFHLIRKIEHDAKDLERASKRFFDKIELLKAKTPRDKKQVKYEKQQQPKVEQIPLSECNLEEEDQEEEESTTEQ